MKEGCKRDICVNIYCKNNPNFKAPTSQTEMLTQALNLWKQCIDEKKYKYWEICCDTDFMKNTYSTVQKHNLHEIKDFSFLVEFVQSPYSLSLSFLKDPSIIGKQDDFGQLKYKLNLDEELVEKFYSMIKEIEISTRANEENEDKADMTSIADMFSQNILHFKNHIEDYLMDESDNLDSKYEIVIPFTIRGLLIHLMNDMFDYEEFNNELQIIIQYLEILLNSEKDVGVYLERYLIQLSKGKFVKIVKRLQQ